MSGSDHQLRLRTERDVIEAMKGRAVTIVDIYAACEASGVSIRNDGALWKGAKVTSMRVLLACRNDRYDG